MATVDVGTNNQVTVTVPHLGMYKFITLNFKHFAQQTSHTNQWPRYFLTGNRL